MNHTIETVGTMKCHDCAHRHKQGENGYYCDKHHKHLEHYRDRSGVWVTKCDECLMTNNGRAN